MVHVRAGAEEGHQEGLGALPEIAEHHPDPGREPERDQDQQRGQGEPPSAHGLEACNRLGGPVGQRLHAGGQRVGRTVQVLHKDVREQWPESGERDLGQLSGGTGAATAVHSRVHKEQELDPGGRELVPAGGVPEDIEGEHPAAQGEHLFG